MPSLSPRILVLAAVLTGVGCARPVAPTVAPSPRSESRVVASATGRDVGFSTMIAAAARADVVFFGEQHDDPATHRAELSVLGGARERLASR